MFQKSKHGENWRVVLPKVTVTTINDFLHTFLYHPGIEKTYSYIQRFYFWPEMRKEIKRWVVYCTLCQKIKYFNRNMNTEFRMIESEHVSDLISVDLFGLLPQSRGGVQHIFFSWMSIRN